MHPTELWWLIEAKMPPKRYGLLTENEMADLYDEMKKKGLLDG